MVTGLTFISSDLRDVLPIEWIEMEDELAISYFIPNELIENIFRHLRVNENERDVHEDWVIIQTNRVCKAWNENAILQEERKKAITHLQKNVYDILGIFPKDIVEIFHRCGLALSRSTKLSYFFKFQSKLPFKVLNKYEEDFLVEKPIMPCRYQGYDSRTSSFDDAYNNGRRGLYTGIIITLWDKNRESKKGIYDSWKGRKNRIDYEDSKKMIEEYGEVKIACYKFIPLYSKKEEIYWDIDQHSKDIVKVKDHLGRILSIKYPNMPQILEQLLMNKHPIYEIPGHIAGNPRFTVLKSYKNSALISAVAIAALAFGVGYFYSNDMLI